MSLRGSHDRGDKNVHWIGRRKDGGYDDDDDDDDDGECEEEYRTHLCCMIMLE